MSDSKTPHGRRVVATTNGKSRGITPLGSVGAPAPIDPSAKLASMRRLVEEMNDADDNDRAIDHETAMSLAELFTDLDVWLKQGGYLPTDWEQTP